MIGRILALTALVALVFLTSAAVATEHWRIDHRRPGHIDGRSDSHVEWWRIDDRRPARWPGSDLDTAQLDSDGDGVLDVNDDCPDTPRGTKVDARGCAMSAMEIVLLDTGSLSLDNVNFETNEAIIMSESYAALNEVGEILEKWDELHIEIAGHTDNQGEADYNLDLSQRRAEAVLEYLTDKFEIASDQYVARGYGETKPVASNDTAGGRAENRRVEFNVLNKHVLKREEPK